MARRRVICDSEDESEGGDFISDLGGDNHTDGGELLDLDPNSDAARSTDPDLFRHLYQDLQSGHHLPPVIPDSLVNMASTSSSPPPAAAVVTKQQKSSTSLTDPPTGMPSRTSANKKKAPITTELANITQVTTPDAPAPAKRKKDVYDFDLSDEEGAATTTTTTTMVTLAKPKPKKKAPNKSEASTAKAKKDGKRKKPHGSSATQPIELDDDDEEASPRPTTKKRKGSGGRLQQTQRHIPDDVDLLVIPTTAEVRDSLGSIVHDTLEAPQTRSDPVSTSSLVIVPPSLTASQEQQYLRVSGSSEMDPNKFDAADGQQQQASLPAPKSQTQGLGSTNTESTILYTTPSGFGSSLVPLGGAEEQSDQILSEPLSERRTQPDPVQPDSSPDELSAHPVGVMSRAKKRKGPPAEEDEPPEEDGWISDNIGFRRENHVPRPSKRRSRAVLEEDEDDEVAAPEQTMPDTCPPGCNEAQATQSVDMGGLDPEFLAAMPDDIRQEIINSHKSAGNTQTTRTRSRARPTEASSGPLPENEDTLQPKKRGRKKKLPATDSRALEADEPAPPPSSAPLTSAKKKRGRPKKTEPAPVPATAPAPVIDQDDRAEDESGPQAEIAQEPRVDELPSVEDGQVSPQPTKAPRKRGRKKKIAEEKPEPVQEEVNEPVREAQDVSEDVDGTLDQNPELPREEEDGSEDKDGGGREALRDISNTVVKTPGKEGADNKSSKDNSKPGPTPRQMPFKIGLSRKSRFPPLLKSLKK